MISRFLAWVCLKSSGSDEHILIIGKVNDAASGMWFNWQYSLGLADRLLGLYIVACAFCL